MSLSPNRKVDLHKYLVDEAGSKLVVVFVKTLTYAASNGLLPFFEEMAGETEVIFVATGLFEGAYRDIIEDINEHRVPCFTFYKNQVEVHTIIDFNTEEITTQIRETIEKYR